MNISLFFTNGLTGLEICYRSIKVLPFLLLIALWAAVGCLTGAVYSEGDKPVLSCSGSKAEEIFISLHLGEFNADKAGKITLNPKWDEYVTDEDGLPVMAVNLAIGNSGDYVVEITENQTLQIPSDANSGSGTGAVRLGKPYIYRDIRGITIFISPFQKAGDALTVSTEMSIKLIRSAGSGTNPKLKTGNKLNPYFIDNYKHLFLNFEQRYEDIAEKGSLLIICYDEFMNSMLPYVNWKKQKGIPTEMYPVTEAGANCEELKQFIQSKYDADSTLTFVQLVGDIAQVPSLIIGYDHSYGPRDPYYTMLEGDDGYPDIFVGRFSAENTEQLETQVTRSIEYEKAVHSGSWMSKAAGVCSDNPPIPGDDDEHNWEHLDNIRPKLLNFTYTEVDRVYANEGADTEDMANSINAGKSLLVYCGEGWTTNLVAPYFSTEEVDNLTNDNMLPFIHAVSCYIGQFADNTCLAEAFMRASNEQNNEPTGAIGMYASAPTQSVDVPMRSQDHFIDLLVSGTKNSMGGLVYNGSCNMIDVYGEDGAYVTFGWNLFGDASLQLRTKQPDTLQINISSQIPYGATSLQIQTGKPNVLVCLSRYDEILASGFTDSDGSVVLQWNTPVQAGDSCLLTATSFNSMPFSQSMECLDNGAGYLSLEDIVLDDNEDGIINSSESIVVCATVRNPSLVSFSDAWVELVSLTEYIAVVDSVYNLGQITAGSSEEAVLSFRISKLCPDYRNIQYRIIIHANNLSWTRDYLITVHSPKVEITDLKILPEKNWLNRGDEIQVKYQLINEGSAKLKNAVCTLTSGKPWIDVLHPAVVVPVVQSGDTLVVSFPVKIKTNAGQEVPFSFDFLMESTNSSLLNFTENHLVVRDSVMMEGFETEGGSLFEWFYPSGSHWQIAETALEVKYALVSPTLQVGESSAAELNFELSQPGKIVFYFKMEGVVAENLLQFKVNNNTVGSWSGNSDWQKAEFTLAGGSNRLNWNYQKNASTPDENDCVRLDAIQFPPGALFSDVQLLADAEEINIVIHPEQIIRAPFYLESLDGRYAEYAAILRQINKQGFPKSEISLSFNRTDFTPGSSDTYLATLYNTLPGRELLGVRLFIPRGVIVTSSSNFTMGNQASIPRTGLNGSNRIITWMGNTGTEADSLRCVLSLMTDISLSGIALDYEITSKDEADNEYITTGTVTLQPSEPGTAFLTFTPGQGTLFECETDRFALTCNQSLLPDEIPGYSLEIFCNGINQLSIPVTVTYDPTPGFDTGKTSLRAYPNPFKDNLTIDYYLPEDGNAEISVYNIKGQKVLQLRKARDYAGKNLLAWNGKGTNAQSLPTGIYFIRLKSSVGQDKVIRCLLVK